MLESQRQDRQFATVEVQQEVALFLAYEAELLDGRHYEEWLALAEDDFTYQVPVPRTPDNPFSPHYDDRSLLIDENKWSLTEQWFKRLSPDVYELSWAENPPVRFRHFVTNVRVRTTDDLDRFEARSNLMLVGTRQSDRPKYVTGERRDTVRRHPDGLKLVDRWVVLDQTVIDFPQLRILL